jgi:hypothetical protein
LSRFSAQFVTVIQTKRLAKMLKLLPLGILSVISCGLAFNGFTELYNVHEEPPIDIDDYKSTISFVVKEKWISQKLDHFNGNSRVWNMRYLENDRFYQPSELLILFKRIFEFQILKSVQF